MAGWRLARQGDPRFRDRPWVIEAIVPGGSSSAAGLEVGDRLLSVGGVPADLDASKVNTVVERPPGTPVVVVLVSKGERKQMVMRLRRLLAPHEP
jgi:S1-C subfamily serine protease